MPLHRLAAAVVGPRKSLLLGAAFLPTASGQGPLKLWPLPGSEDALEVLRHPLHAARRIPALRALLRRLDVPAFRNIDGLPFPVCMRLGPNLAMWLRGRAAEQAELDTFVRLARALQARLFVDAGANVGLYSFHFVASRPGGHVISVEPDPANVECLRRTIARAGLASVEVQQIALSDREGDAIFLFDDVAGATGQLKDVGPAFVERHYRLLPREGRVRTGTLDRILGGRRPDILKIDVEGAEARVLQGAAGALRQVRPALILEMGDAREQCTALLADAGYALRDVRTLGPLEAGTWNALALPRERADMILASL
jgi:FkbM family methyltransferase